MGNVRPGDRVRLKDGLSKAYSNRVGHVGVLGHSSIKWDDGKETGSTTYYQHLVRADDPESAALKVGDLVRVVHCNGGGLISGLEYRVTEVLESGRVRVNGSDLPHDASEFVAVVGTDEPEVNEEARAAADTLDTVDLDAPIEQEAEFIGDDGWWDVDGVSELYVGEFRADLDAVKALGLEVRVQVRRTS